MKLLEKDSEYIPLEGQMNFIDFLEEFNAQWGNMKQRSKAQLLQDRKVYEGMQKDAAKGSNIAGSVVYWRMTVQWYLVLRDEFYFNDKDIQRILGLITKKDIYNLSTKKKQQIDKMIEDTGCDLKILNIVSSNYNKKSLIDTTIHNLANYNTEISINYSLLMFEYLIRYQGFDRVKVEIALQEISYLDALGSDKIWKYREEIFDDTGFWISLDGEPPEDAYHMDFNVYSKNKLGM